MKTYNSTESANNSVSIKSKKKRYIAGTITCTLLFLISGLCFFAAFWYMRTYGRTGFDSILYTLTADLDGLQIDLFLSFCLKGLVPAFLITALGAYVLHMLSKEKFRRVLSRSITLVLSLVMIVHAAIFSGLPKYIYGLTNETDLFDKYYVQPSGENIKFPEQKRNLIYIFMESMEISFLSEELGGIADVNLIPELYQLGCENINFSHDDSQVGGFLPVSGATWTIGAMVAHTSGVPLEMPLGVTNNDYGQDENGFLPGITSLQDILHEQGYYQTLMVGSVASFGGREQYYGQHGTDHIYDISTAYQDDVVEDGYFVWWGMEDKYLFEYAKEELTEISQKDQPFAFTMLTVDTHHIGGYVCEYCGSDREEQYENVMSCASRQVLEFVQWLKEQPYYENTTIVITGDHLSMDNGYFLRCDVGDEYTRRNYNCFINSAVEAQNNKNRQFSALDMFPTTLAAMGCTIEGDYLGLGVNLFSGKPTLIEKLGYEEFDLQLTMLSEYYAVNFRLEEPAEE